MLFVIVPAAVAVVADVADDAIVDDVDDVAVVAAAVVQDVALTAVCQLLLMLLGSYVAADVNVAAAFRFFAVCELFCWWCFRSSWCCCCNYYTSLSLLQLL